MVRRGLEFNAAQTVSEPLPYNGGSIKHHSLFVFLGRRREEANLFRSPTFSLNFTLSTNCVHKFLSTYFTINLHSIFSVGSLRKRTINKAPGSKTVRSVHRFWPPEHPRRAIPRVFTIRVKLFFGVSLNLAFVFRLVIIRPRTLPWVA